MPVLNRIADFHDDLVDWRHDIHRHPELAFEEHRTAALVAEKLRGFGFDEVVEGIGGTGVVGVLRQGDGPMIGLRADMDALPIVEAAEDRPHKSVHHGVMHACGHDGHTTMLLGAARYLAETRRFSGTLVFIFQPAEEGRAGARAMIEDGLFDRFPVSAVWGVHNMPGLPAGSVAVSPGPVMAAADRFTITIQGKGAHAAAPHLGRDPVVAGAALVQALQALVSRHCPPHETLVVSVTEFHAGDTFNVLPDAARLGGTVRYFDKQIGEQAIGGMKRMAEGIGAAHGVEVSVDYQYGYPPTVNTAGETEAARAVVADTFGAERVLDQAPVMFAEDFSFFLQEKPGAYGFIGNGEGSEDLGCVGLHNPRYDFNDDILTTGATFFARLAESQCPQR
ncbi:Catalyzes the cleavage of p-aminobenzoyl-glutamate to p-aminobenzoate and glutamate, subunit A [Caenispirillum salinarum AK4]|uniref:Catalyzes the cleavage of p-aminobenzoyl-glutamate to p-aminobenzoate and glutamate, subunit A n=1 Tax=Caenispirillum salinarum AK4 TaxID=1238182 RepID=K9H1P8_9PROT|nr:M20 aminoacylase family protein [Caenispirillum salinarum]EKV31492.1 Catalyzes the cleavage of p-aminobenzoyl-glutamate to p-aminobenzoate and glutamate, subunit A [Caenispirillum salinarum AK4]